MELHDRDSVANALATQGAFALVASATVEPMDLDDLNQWRRTRFAQLAERVGGNAALGRALGYKDGAFIGQMLRGQRPITEKTIQQAEGLPGASGWFAGPAQQSALLSPPNVEDVELRGGAVPLISWVQAGSFADVADPFLPGDAEAWLPCPARHGKRSYCLRVRGDSMFNPDGRPSYAEGEILFVDPDADVLSGDRVIVRLEDDQQVTFKQYMEEGNRKYLKALNPKWEPRYIPINGRATICGKVIGTWRPE